MKWHEYAAPRFAALHPHGRATAEDVRIAAHEAGHAIARWSNGISIEGITIEPDDKDGRKINGRVWGDTDDDDFDFFARCVVLVAGCTAERVYLEESMGLRGSDRRKAHRAARNLCDSETAADLVVEAAKHEAEHLLREHERALDVLASTLLERRTMDGRSVVELIEREAARPAHARQYLPG
jgi:ATP-dependent Zn protease